MFDVDFARSHFPALSDPYLEGHAFFENAGGSYACQQTIQRLTDYYTKTKVQPKHPHKPAIAAIARMEESKERWAAAMGVAKDEVNFGPSTTANTYILSQAFGRSLPEGSQVVTTNQDHEANSGAMRTMAKERGFAFYEWLADPVTGQLSIDDLLPNISANTRLVSFTHCSNIVGNENPVADWCKAIKAKAPEAVIIVDGVSHSPHAIPQPWDLGCDIYLFSLYKVYSVHQGMMVVRKDLIESLPNQGHNFNAGLIGKRLTPAGPDHAQEASAQGVLDYIEALDKHHGGDGAPNGAARRVSALWSAHEQTLKKPLLEFLSARNDLRLLGSSELDHRHPTIAVSPAKIDAHAFAVALGQMGLGVGSGHFYSARLVDRMGVGADKGVTRFSLVHYNTAHEVTRLIDGMKSILDAA